MMQLPLDLFGAAPGNSLSSELNRAPALDWQARTAPDLIETQPPSAPLPAPAHFKHPRANRRIVLGTVRVDYLLRRGRRRTIGFVIDADGLRVSAPRWTLLAEVDAALRERERWILDQLAHARQRQRRLDALRIDWRDGARVPYLGQSLVLRSDPRQRHGRGGAALGPDGSTLVLGLPALATPEQWRDAVQAWLHGQARRLFTARLDHYAPQLTVRWQRLALSSAATRWGSASRDGSIRLNWRLIHFSLALIDYVVVHELAHLREMNHGPRFWQHVQGVLPDYAERRAALKDAVAPPW